MLGHARNKAFSMDVKFQENISGDKTFSGFGDESSGQILAAKTIKTNLIIPVRSAKEVAVKAY